MPLPDLQCSTCQVDYGSVVNKISAEVNNLLIIIKIAASRHFVNVLVDWRFEFFVTLFLALFFTQFCDRWLLVCFGV